MGMRIVALSSAAAVAFAVAGTSPELHANPSPAGAGADEHCVVYSEVSHDETRSLDVRLANTCAKPMSCNIAWTVTCGKTATVTRRGAVLAGSADQSWVASAASCEDDWSIDTTWGCRPSR
jgi:hypothetical protein